MEGWIGMDGYGWMDMDGWIWMDGYGWMDMDGWIRMDGYGWMDMDRWGQRDHLGTGPTSSGLAGGGCVGSWRMSLGWAVGDHFWERLIEHYEWVFYLN